MAMVENLLTFLGMASLFAGLVYQLWKVWIVDGDAERARNAATALTIVFMSIVYFIAWNQHKDDQVQLNNLKDELQNNIDLSDRTISALKDTAAQVKIFLEKLNQEQAKSKVREEILSEVLKKLAEGIWVSRQVLNEAQQNLSILRQNYSRELLGPERREYIKTLLSRLRNQGIVDLFNTRETYIVQIEAQIVELQQASEGILNELGALDLQLRDLQEQINGLSNSFIGPNQPQIGPEIKSFNE